MPHRYRIALFVRQNGECPVEDYLFDGKNETDLTVLISAIQRLARVGQELLGTNIAKEMRDYKPICELRKDRHRIFYAYDKPSNRFILLSAFLKQTQTTPMKELEQARNYWFEYQRHRHIKPIEHFPLDY